MPLLFYQYHMLTISCVYTYASKHCLPALLHCMHCKHTASGVASTVSFSWPSALTYKQLWTFVFLM